VGAKIRTIDKEKIKVATRMFLEAIGEDPEDERFKRTPERVAKFWQEFLNQGAVTIRVFEERHNGLVVVKDIPFFSICEHHLLPFYGTASVGYVPRGKVIGLSKIVRIVTKLACKPQLQERLTDQIADYLWNTLKPLGVIAVTKALHFCMTMRRLGDQTTQTIAAALRGKFYDDAALRAEVYNLLKME
jgi:GTP cyclohydrolase I